MDVGVRGEGPAVAAVEAALGDIEATIVPGAEPAAVDLTVVVGRVGDAAFESANQAALAAGAEWIAVELGGIGGVPVVDAAVAGLGPGRCYECLRGRVEAATAPETEPAAAPSARTARFAGAIAGRLAATAVAESTSVAGRALTLPYAERELLGLPGCSCADDRDRRSMSLEAVDRSLEASLSRAERGVDERLGIVTEVGEAESFPAPYYLAESCVTDGFSDATAARQAAGVAAGWDAAFMKALGEAFERYAAGVYRTDEFETAIATALEPTVAPSAFVAPGEPDDEPRPWVRGQNLHTTGEVWLPAELVHYPPPATGIRPPITTGLGLGNGTVGAILSGLYEVIERDAAMLSWYSTFDPLGLAVEDERFERLAARARSAGLSVRPVLLTQDVDVPVVAVALEADSWPRFALGTDADLDAASAARGALAEALQNWLELRGMGPDEAGGASGAIGRYASDPGEAAAFVESDSTVPAASVGPDDPPEGRAELERVLELVSAAGADMSTYAARLTTRDIETLGFEAVRVLIPAAQPLFFGDSYFGRRAREVPEAMGFAPRLDRPHHPFP